MMSCFGLRPEASWVASEAAMTLELEFCRPPVVLLLEGSWKDFIFEPNDHRRVLSGLGMIGEGL